MTDLDPNELLSSEFQIEEAKPDEVNVLVWPTHFIPISDSRAIKGLEYIKSRGLFIEGDMYYDLDNEGIVFPYYFSNHFCGAQVRFIKERVRENGDKWKITTLPGTRLGLLFYGWNQENIMAQTKGFIVTEGAFNAIGIQQALNLAYGGVSHNPWRVLAASGSGLSTSQAEILKELKDRGYKIIGAPDTDEAGLKMLSKMKDAGCITHFCLTKDSEKDWNDFLKQMEHKEFAKWFIKNVEAL
jgi:DNA primase